MRSHRVNIVTGLIAFIILAVFIIGLTKSIIDGFAGFEGGLPFAIIVAFVLSLAAYDFYDTAIRKNK